MVTERHELYSPDGRLVASCTSREAVAAAERLLAPVRVESQCPRRGTVRYEVARG